MNARHANEGQLAGQSNGIRMDDIPEEILEIIQLRQSPRFLNALAAAALKPALTLKLFTIFDSVFTDTCARLIELDTERRQQNTIIEAFARILPLAPHLSTFLEKYLEITSSPGHERQTWRIQSLWFKKLSLDTLALQRILLAAFRLLSFDNTFSHTISGSQIQSYLQHENAGVRYLAVRVFCQLCSASDSKLEAMIEKNVGKVEAIMGDYDGRKVDYGFLSLFEEKRLKDAKCQMSSVTGESTVFFQSFNLEALSPLIIRHTNTLVPRPNGPSLRPSVLITTATTSHNQESLAKSLLSSSPILLHGLAGSGKTSLVNDFARELGVDSNMVTLHLNEQTDAKMLIGMYATGSTPGSFTWRAGVLTTAVREGRWVFIEDLDRAPNEVISVILPLIERGELSVPSRGETIKAGRGFRLLASIRTSLSVTGHENPPAMHMLGARLWRRVPVQMPAQDEFRQIIDGTHPILHQFLSGIISVYNRLCSLSQSPSFASRSRTSLGRPISPRDLLKWCQRLDGVLSAAGCKTGQEPITESTTYEMFLEATDCFSSNLQTEDARRAVIFAIAKEMHIDPQRAEHFITAHIPKYEDTDSRLTIGRVRLAKKPANRVTKSAQKSRPFANTTHTKRLLEQVGVAVKMAEPVLLVGETGIGKTTVIQQLADTLGYKLTAVNLSQQSEVGDLLGGFKPVNVRSLAIPLKEEFDDLFAATGISATRNEKYLEQLKKSIAKSQWSRASKLWHEAPKMFDSILAQLEKKKSPPVPPGEPEQRIKRRKTESKLQELLQLVPRWKGFSESLEQFDIQLLGGSKGFAFTFVEGNIVKAARNGEWVLLDEINLASPDTIESIADLLHHGSGESPSILLSETGEIERVKAHPNFRIFGAMNPATDVGKRDLPMGLRSRFTEIYVGSPDRTLDDLLPVVKAYLRGTSSNDERAAHDVASLYIHTKRLADDKSLVDGANQVPHFSLRTLTRVLSYVNEIAPSYGLRRALYEGFAMGFLTLLNRESEQMLEESINHYLLSTHKNSRALMSQTPKHPEDGRQYVKFMNGKKDRQYWMLQGHEPRHEESHYIRTPSVERNMLNLVRATSTRRFPVLVQGPTSSGKTSMIEYLAKFSGNKFVRINNHEHTDLQEYLGTYVSGSDGQLRFQEGLLVQALRQGHWIVLDELNLAPTDVLEALNRLLDDNRELLIPETQETVRPHENFMLFATQNPPGLYGGRKTLSRAFRNRFLELHFDDIPQDELQQILQYRSQNVAPSDCERIVKVYKELSTLRQTNRLFEQKDSFATLRDLFRWALRKFDTREELAANGYMLLAERVRNPAERVAVKEIIEKVMKVRIDSTVLYSAAVSDEIKQFNTTSNSEGVVWTQAMSRLYVLVAHALRNNEPVLLVGETGCGKTTVCQMLADAFAKELHIVNAHQNTETGDLIGAQRPVRNRVVILSQLKDDLMMTLNGLGYDNFGDDLDAMKAAYKSLPKTALSQIPEGICQRIETNLGKSKALFEWSDGSLVQALKNGQFFLLDEISLADDSVLERLNSVLEPARTILLAEKGVENSFVKAADGFQFFATMNPGGDYGKRELSPALRNRFTEIWVPSLSEHEDVFQIVDSKLNTNLKPFSNAMVHFAKWFGQNYRSTSATSISVRDVLAWVKFMNCCESSDPYFAVLHGAAMVYIDTLGANPAALLAISPESILEERAKCLQQLSKMVDHDMSLIHFNSIDLINNDEVFAIGSFSIPKHFGSETDPGFAFHAPTTKLNAMRIVRALQVQKPILIEGSPGVGKTTLIVALARACNRPLTRINLSEQTDLMDLFGSDVPIEGAEAGHFAWRDAPFLQAMQKGEWVLLDEMNLASQSVLEGLNACLDHRGEVYISELDQTFKRHPNFSVFAAQNPHHQGGGRKGLPSSFVNRFTVVYADVFRTEDLKLICKHNFPTMPEEIISTIIAFVSQLEHEIVYQRRFGSQGGPWEFNLRDILRWLQLLSSSDPLLTAAQPSDFLNLIFRNRFRTFKDRQEVDKIYSNIFGSQVPFRHFFRNASSSAYQVGLAYIPRDMIIQRLPFPAGDPSIRATEVESVMMCIQQSIPCILVGPSGYGKTTILEYIAAISGKSLVVFPLNADIDTMDLVGGFEQVDPQRAASTFLNDLEAWISVKSLSLLPAKLPEEAIAILELLKGDIDSSASLFGTLASHLRSLQMKTSLSEFETLAAGCERFSKTPMTLDNARFEWVDGALVKAMERGDWLVLDNANLCSASVLDRLNSLLEPNGFLSINEHCGPDGEPKLVKPHHEFRIFLTMDARFGELSRAMRNRATEIFLDSCVISINEFSDTIKPEAAMQRFRNLSAALDVDVAGTGEPELLISAALDSLSWSDMPLLSRFVASCTEAQQNYLAITCPAYMELSQNLSNKSFRMSVESVLGTFAKSTKLALADFTDAQIIHPLQNSPLVPLLVQSQGSEHVFWLGAVFELILEIEAAKRAQLTQSDNIEALKPSKMNRMQRSLVKGRVPAVGKDTTANISDFLANTLEALELYLRANIDDTANWKARKNVLKTLLRFWWDTLSLATSHAFEESKFQAHLGIGTNTLAILESSANHNTLIGLFNQHLQNDFSSGFKLSTGLSMEVLWKHLRPIVISKSQVMLTLTQIEHLAMRFDALRWITSISVSELGTFMTSLVKAYNLILTSDVDGESLVKILTEEMDKLETSIGEESDTVMPFLSQQFEALRQFKLLSVLRSGNVPDQPVDVDTIVLANYETTSEMRFASSTQSSRLLQSIDYLWGAGDRLQPLTGTFTVDVLRKLNGVGEVGLKSLKLLEVELPILADKLASSSAILGADQLSSLQKTLSILISDVLGQYEGLAFTPVHFQEVARDYFAPPQSKSFESSSMAWANFAIGSIILYVPDRAFDPDTRQRLEHQRHNCVRSNLEKKLAALRRFEHMFSGQESNLRCQMLEDEIEDLGESPYILQEIYRPEPSGLDQLQGEFSNLLKVVVGSGIPAMLNKCFEDRDEKDFQAVLLLQTNVAQIVRRLSERFREYNDLTAPVISMLRCLQIGLSLAGAALPPNSVAVSSMTLCNISPFLGGGPNAVEHDFISQHPMEYFALMGTTASTEGLDSFDPMTRQSLLKAFHACYEQWKRRLESDRVKAELKGGLYRFRGSAEDEEEDDQEEFNELFPAYDDTSEQVPTGTSAANSVHDTAVDLAKAHEGVFLRKDVPHESLMALVRQISRKIGSLRGKSHHTGQQNITSSLLPGALLLLHDNIESLSPAAVPASSYNFYTEQNLPEARKLVNLVHEIQSRFRALQAVDEIAHMQPLEDVLASCGELMQFRHTEPLAKIITKVEKIHTFLHEWQFGGWASRANSALIEYDKLTQTIVSWRRLELSTWAKLFDMETEKCEDDARSWFFVAYEVIIAAPLGISESQEELKTYAQKLLKDLEVYFSTAIMGQYVQRLELLKQLSNHLEVLILDVPAMSIILSALTNFIALYARYEKPVQETLKKGKITLEKAMKDVLLLASWKDTNIVALRDSAKRSHHKLFKIVRKFRALLGQPMEALLCQGLPDESPVDAAAITTLSHQSSVDLSALQMCADTVLNWAQKSKRFVNVSRTVSMMTNASELPADVVDGSAYLESFLGNIITSTAELQHATPSVLTKDNKDEVKHLKNRKRKLYSDTLKELRHMGVKYNLGADALAKQDSLSLVLTSSDVLSGLPITGLEYYFHKSVDLAPRTRAAAQKHSEDLSSAEIARSLGFLEGMLQLLIAQHKSLSAATSSMSKLQAAVELAGGLWAPGLYDIKVIRSTTSHKKVLRWLPNILAVAVNLIKVHSKLGKKDSKDIIEVLQSWCGRFANLCKQHDALSKLPENITSTQRLAVESNVSDSVHQFNIDMSEIIENRPDLASVLNQIIPWTSISASAGEEESSMKTITLLDQKLSTVCDAVLTAIQKHKNIIADMPTATEDPGWLMKHHTTLALAIKSLHCDDITRQIEQAFKALRCSDLENEATSRTAGAIFAVALPILQQYTITLQQTILQYGQLHQATCKTSYILSKTFSEIATRGFCTPSEKSDAQDGKTEKIEGGTGLGDGEGADDISKDIQEDEDLDELAQEPNTGDKQDIEDEQDAVDMADGEMEGEMGEAEEKEAGEDDGSGDEESGDEMDEEAGDVDDLDPTAVDEKMWDGDNDQAEKDQEGSDEKGTASKDEQVAAEGNTKEVPEEAEGDESGDEEDMQGDEQGEVIKQDEVEKHDPHAEEGDALDLPEDMELDGEEEKSKNGSDDGIDELPDMEEDGKDEDVTNDGEEEAEAEDANGQENQEVDDMDIIDLDEEDPENPGDQTEDAGEKIEEEAEDQQPEDIENLLRDQEDGANADADNAAPSDVQGVGEDQDKNEPNDKNESDSKAQREDGKKGGDSSEEKDFQPEDGEKGRQADGDAPQDGQDETQDSSDAQPFKKLGDALESWHRQQTSIKDPIEQKEEKTRDQDVNTSGENPDFQHLQDEEAEPDAQALGVATEEQAHALDESMAVDSESKEMPEQFQPDEVEDGDAEHDDVMQLEETPEPKDIDFSGAYEGRAGAMIKQAQLDRDDDMDNTHARAQEFDSDVEEVDKQLESTHLDLTSLDLRSAADARQRWIHFEGLTRDLSLSLTEQLRLILAPTLATKMRGDFRTGKRLNIKRIIPYIASQYKRDKIWMRRSVPSKRAYQIMLAVDDSKSMGESGSGSLAMETLVMVSKSLSMLEVGQICVVGFGQDVKVAHDFETPFSSDAGPKVFQQFGFEQDKTDITRLVRESIELFREARRKASGTPADLWQMQLIISDGVCNSSEHDAIRRLLREALEERIMMVFVIVDDVKNKKPGESVMDLQEASFVDGELKIARYLDTFPFQYYLVVSDVKDLPGVLATLLRQWFAEVVDSH